MAITWKKVAYDADIIGYTLNFTALNLVTIVDGSTYYVGGQAIAPQTTGGINRVYVPKSGTIKHVYIFWYAVTAGSAEDIALSIMINNAIDNAIETISDTSNTKVFGNLGLLNIAVTAGNYLEVKIVCPAWATNPANVKISGFVYIK